MKRILTALALICAASSAMAQAPAQTDPVREHRIWAGEQMVDRVAGKLARSIRACDNTNLKIWMPRLSDECKATVIGTYPILGKIREIATTGDANDWAKLIDKVHALEATIDHGLLPALERQ